MSEKSVWTKDDLTCKPLDSYEDVLTFLQNPPSWSTLCEDLRPHSQYLIKNIEINNVNTNFSVESPLSFCHLDNKSDILIKRHERKNLPKTLICHDMANGYHDDSLVEGSPRHDAYAFWQWAAVDTFCYFSHHLVTVPPVGWINAAHAHGAKCIGTVITEWEQGATFWDGVLASEPRWRDLASALVAIAKALHFDGWLLNIENSVKNPAALLEFVRFLHATMHRELLEPELIWYDSVTVDGKLSWQNGLNEKNRAFFDACDGIFTNYSWSERLVAASAATAGARVADLYVGVDVWGRNFFGGGQFNTAQAVEVVHRHGCSLALFAPAWTHEAVGVAEGGAALALPLHRQFVLRERALWGSLWPYLNTKLPSALPFHTSFCRGYGTKRRLYGEVLSPSPWYNLRHMQYQPNSTLGSHGYLLCKLENIQYLKQLGEDRLSRWRDYLNHSIIKETDLENKMDSKFEESIKDPENENKNMSQSPFQLKLDDKRVELEKEIKAESALPGQKDETDRVITKKIPDTRYTLVYIPEELECLEWTLDDSFIGGSCIKINPSDEVSTEHRTSRLFYCDFHCQHSLVVCVVTKPLPGLEDQFLYVSLNVVNHDLENWEVLLIGCDWPDVVRFYRNSANVLNVAPLNPSTPEFRQVQKYLMLNEPTFYVPVENRFGWKVRYFEVQLAESRVTSVSCRAGHPGAPLLLGHFALCSKPQNAVEE